MVDDNDLDRAGRDDGDEWADYVTYLRSYLRTLVDPTTRAKSLPSDTRRLWLAARAAWDAKRENEPVTRSQLERLMEKAGFEPD